MKNSQTSNFEEKKLMALNVFEILEQIIFENFFMKLTQFDKTESIRGDFILLGSDKQVDKIKRKFRLFSLKSRLGCSYCMINFFLRLFEKELTPMQN